MAVQGAGRRVRLLLPMPGDGLFEPCGRTEKYFRGIGSQKQGAILLDCSTTLAHGHCKHF